jgi:hypothetical protein
MFRVISQLLPCIPAKPYTLSYRWGHASDFEIIYLNVKERRVGRNLASALRHIRTKIFGAYSPLSPLIWADAVCINQNDEEEKSYQVQFMGAIYSNASTVVSWVGADKDGKMTAAVAAMDYIQHVATSVPDWLEDLHWMQDYPSFLEVDNNLTGVLNQVFRSLMSFFSQPIWLRV